MKFFAVASFFAMASAVCAVPHYGGSPSAPPSTGNAVIDQCGAQNLSCCNKEVNKVSVKGTENDSGVLNGIAKGLNIGDLSVFDQCSKLNIPINIIGVGVSDFLNKNCAQTVACCQGNSPSANGLVAVALPACIPIQV